MPKEVPVTEVLSDAVVAQGDAAAIIESTRSAAIVTATPRTFDNIPNLLLATTPDDYSREVVDLDEYAAAPRRKRSTVHVTTTASLAQYVNVHHIDGTTAYADPEALSVEAVLNDHAAALPGHRDHRALLKLTRTPGCLRWLGAHGKYIEQEAFAQLIEDGLTEIARPDGAQLLELAQTMHATTSATFRSAIRLDSGQVQFQYVEEVDARAGATGDIAIPSTITLVFEPFFGAEPIQIEARLRYRLNGGKLGLGVWLIRHQEAMREAFNSELNALTNLTKPPLVALLGSA